MELRRLLRGFTLIEMMVAMFVFAVLMTAIVSIFGTIMRNNNEAEDMQRNVENASTALNLMAKTIRTGAVLSIQSDSPSELLHVYDYSTSSCVEFEFLGNQLLWRSEGMADSSNCPGSLVDTPALLVDAFIEGGLFHYTVTNPDLNDPSLPVQQGVVSIVFDVYPPGTTGTTQDGTDYVHIQTSVSTRDFQ